MALYLCVLLPKTSFKKKNSLVIRRISDKSQERGVLQYVLPGLLKINKVIKDKEDLRSLHSQEEPKETGQLNVMCHLDGILK